MAVSGQILSRDSQFRHHATAQPIACCAGSSGSVGRLRALKLEQQRQRRERPEDATEPSEGLCAFDSEWPRQQTLSPPTRAGQSPGLVLLNSRRRSGRRAGRRSRPSPIVPPRRAVQRFSVCPVSTRPSISDLKRPGPGPSSSARPYRDLSPGVTGPGARHCKAARLAQHGVRYGRRCTRLNFGLGYFSSFPFPALAHPCMLSEV